MLNIADVEERWIALYLVPTVGQSRGIFAIIFVVVIPACIFILPVLYSTCTVCFYERLNESNNRTHCVCEYYHTTLTLRTPCE